MITKSPYSKRTIKKGKLGGDPYPVPLATPHTHTSSVFPQSPGPSIEASAKTIPTTILPVAPSPAQTLLEHLTTQLETVVRTVDTLLQNPDIAHLDTTHTKQVLCHLNERLNSGATTQLEKPASPCQNTARTHTPTQKKTYAEATSTTKCSNLKGPSRNQHNKTGNKPSLLRRTDFGQLIIDFDNTVKQIPSDKIKDALNKQFTVNGKLESRVAGAKFSQKGNLVLTFTPASSARRFLSPILGTSLIACLRYILGFSDKVAMDTHIYTTDPWHRVVIHGIPFRDAQEDPEGHGPDWWEQNINSIFSDWKECNPLSLSAALRCRDAARLLISDATPTEELRAKGTTALCVAFDNIKHAHRLVQEGVFIHGKHCRASPYRPMSRPRS